MAPSITTQVRHEETKARLARLGFDVSKFKLILDTGVGHPPAQQRRAKVLAPSSSSDAHRRDPLTLDALYAEIFGRDALDEINRRVH